MAYFWRFVLNVSALAPLQILFNAVRGKVFQKAIGRRSSCITNEYAYDSDKFYTFKGGIRIRLTRYNCHVNSIYL